MAVAQEQEMIARIQEMRASVVEAEAKVPLALADAFPERAPECTELDHGSRRRPAGSLSANLGETRNE